jgi:integrase
LALKRRINKWQATIRIPKDLQEAYGCKTHLYQIMAAQDRKSAQLESEAWMLALKAEWAALTSGDVLTATKRRELYQTIRSLAANGRYTVANDPAAFDDVTAGIEERLDRISDRIGQRDLTPTEQAEVYALNDAKAEREGREVPRRAEMEPSFRELSEAYLHLWRIAPGRKPTNTEQQKASTFDLFAKFFGGPPIREVGRGDASTFADALRQLDPNWARTGKARGQSPDVTWSQLMKAHGGRSQGLSDATVNRHMATLSAFWQWSEEREHCEGRNPFAGHRRKLSPGRNKHGYIAWEVAELQALFAPAPKRADLTEVMLVAMHTGMRLNEIASLTFDQIKTDGGVQFIDITDAKTQAGERRVPLHPNLAWLTKRSKEAKKGERVWPKFTLEGPGKKPGGDAGKQFSQHKLSRGFTERKKAFHSFRKNVVGQLEQAGVQQHEVAQLVGHEKQGLTFSVYGSSMTLERLAGVVALIEYPDVILPTPAEA